MQPSTLAKRVWLLLFLTVIILYFYGLGHIPFVGPDEPRYAQVAREMFLRGDLITPTLGGHTWFEKPALLYWMMIGSFSLFGVSEWAARLGPAVSGLLTGAAVYWVGKRAEVRTSDPEQSGLGAWSSLICASTSGIIIFSRGASFDIVVTMTVTWALSFYLVSDWEENARRRGSLLVGFYIFVGLSLLAKGLVGIVIPFGVIGGYYILRWQLPPRQTLWSLFWGVPLTVAVAATWYGPVIAQHGWTFIDQFFIQHHFERYLSNKYHHPQPVYFYPVMIMMLTLPWSAFLIEGIMESRNWSRRAESPMDRFRVFSFAWILVPLIFFSMSGSKLPGYILPVLPAVALIAGERIARLANNRQTANWAMRVTGAIFLLFAIGGIVFSRLSGDLTTQCTLIIAAPVICAGAFALFLPHVTRVAAILIAATLVAFVVMLNCGVAGFAQRDSERDLIQRADARGYGSVPVYFLHQISRTAEFYAAGRIAYGPDGEPLRFEGTSEVVNAVRQVGGVALVMVPVEYLRQLTELRTLKSEVIADNGEIAIVSVSLQ